jgi:hypothetical protein
VNAVESSLAPQVVETLYRPGLASERTVAVPNRCHGWWPSGLPFSAPTSRTDECTALRLSRHATSSDTAEPGAPCSGDTLNQLNPGTDVVSSGGSAVWLGDVLWLDDVLWPGDELGSVGLAATEQAVVSIPRLTTPAIAEKVRTLMSAACWRRA